MPILFGAIVLLVSATLMLGVNISALRGSLDGMEHSQQVLNNVATLENGLMGYELTVRGYALTGDPSFISMQKAGAARRQKAIANLTRLVTHDSDHVGALHSALAGIERHTATYEKLAGTGASQVAIVAKTILDPAVRANTLRTRTSLAYLRDTEMRKLADRQRDITSQLFRAFFLAITIIVAAFLLGGIGVWASQIGRREKC